jgi:hypothetical protein
MFDDSRPSRRLKLLIDKVLSLSNSNIYRTKFEQRLLYVSSKIPTLKEPDGEKYPILMFL